MLTQISRNFSNYDERFGFKGERTTTSPKYTGKRQGRHGIASKQDSKPQRKLFKQRVVSESDKQAEQEDADMLRNLPESARFGTGVGQFVEISQASTQSADQGEISSFSERICWLLKQKCMLVYCLYIYICL